MNKKIIFAGLSFIVFMAVVFSANAATTTPTIKVVSPNGGEVWKAGTTKNIVFKGNLIKEPVDILLNWSGNSMLIGDIVTSERKTYTYSWTIPTTLEQRNDYKVSVYYRNVIYNNSNIKDESDKTFTIKNSFSSSSSKSSKSSKSSSSKSSKLSSSSKSSATSTPTSIYKLKINKSGKGYVYTLKEGIDCGKDCKEKYMAGDIVELRAIADSGYIFEKFVPEKECFIMSFDVQKEAATCSTIMDKNKTITVVFKKVPGKSSSSTKSSKASSSKASSSKASSSKASSSKSSSSKSFSSPSSSSVTVTPTTDTSTSSATNSSI